MNDIIKYLILISIILISCTENNFNGNFHTEKKDEFFIEFSTIKSGVYSSFDFDNYGNIYLTGEFENSISIDNLTLHSRYKNNSFIIKIDSNGKSVSGSVLSGKSVDIISGEDGNITYVGLIDNSLSGNGADINLYKFNKNDDIIWESTFGTSGEESICCATINSSDKLFIAGSTQGIFDNKTSNLGSGFVIKLNENGEKIWAKHLGIYPGKIVSIGNDLYITGLVKNSQNISKIITSKLDINGEVIWSKSIDSSGTSYGKNLLFLQRNKLYVIGDKLYSKWWAQEEDTDGVLIKYDSFGNEEWSIEIHSDQSTTDKYSNKYDYMQSITSDNDGNIIVGWSSFGDYMGFSNIDGKDIFLSKYSEDGEFIKSYQISKSHNDSAKKIAADKSGHIYILGEKTEDFNGIMEWGLFLKKIKF